MRRRVRGLGLGCVLLVSLGLPLAMPAQAERDGVGMVIGPAQGDALHVMTFNLRYATDSGPNSWPTRRQVMAELLRLEQPTVLGTQEGLYAQLRDIEADLPAYYDWIGLGRAGGSRDEFAAIFYDSRRLAPLAFDHFWLSETPTVIGSKSWGSASIRMVTWVRFADTRTKSEFVMFNTHLDNRSKTARVRAAEMLRDRINAVAPRVPVVVTGDFNVPAEDSAPYDILLGGAGMTDTWTAATERRSPRYATWHGYHPPVADGERIDWILARGATTVPATAINLFGRDGQLPSDHFPVQALIKLGERVH